MEAQAESKIVSIIQFNNKNSSPSFILNWIGFSFLELFVLCVGLLFTYNPRFNNDNALGALANQREATTYGFAIALISMGITFFTSWIPAALFYSLSSKKYKKGEATKPGFDQFSKQQITDFIDRDLNSNLMVSRHPWVAENWLKLNAIQKEEWVREHRFHLDAQLKRATNLMELIAALQETDKEFLREKQKVS